MYHIAYFGDSAEEVFEHIEIMQESIVPVEPSM